MSFSNVNLQNLLGTWVVTGPILCDRIVTGGELYPNAVENLLVHSKSI